MVGSRVVLELEAVAAGRALNADCLTLVVLAILGSREAAFEAAREAGLADGTLVGLLCGTEEFETLFVADAATSGTLGGNKAS